MFRIFLSKPRVLIGRRLSIALLTLVVVSIMLAAGGLLAEPQTIKGIEVNQALGVQKDNNKNFVAGKATVVRVFLNSPMEIEFDRQKTYVQVALNGERVFKLYPKKITDEEQSVVDFLCDSMEYCGKWVSGSYTFYPFINGVEGNPSGPFIFARGTPIRILAVSVKANYGSGGIKTVPDDKWKRMGDFMQNVYPLAEGNLVWHIYPVVLDASSEKFNLESSSGPGTENLSKALSNLIPARCKTSPNDNGCFDFVVGFIKEGIIQDNGKGLAGYAYPGSMSVVVVAEDDDAPGTVAHEIAHQFGIGDTYNDRNASTIRCSVNPAPDGFLGLNWDNGGASVTSCMAGRMASTLFGKDGKTLINGAQVAVTDHPYEVKGRGALPEMADFMSASGALQSQLWITKDSYDWLFRRLVKQEPGLERSKSVLTASSTQQRFVSFSGTISDTYEVEVDLWKSYTDSASMADTTGSLMVQAINASGRVVASSAFTVEFFMHHPPKRLTKTIFEGVVRFPADTVKFQVVKDGRVLTEVPVSDSPPEVSDVTPKTGMTIDGEYRITWRANDIEGDRLLYAVLYNHDAADPTSEWLILDDELETNSLTVDFSELPGGNNAKIRVIAYDGVLYGEADSAEFRVPIKRPEVYIEELPWGKSYRKGSDILLVADVYDLQDGLITGNSVKWSSNISGLLGHGAELIVRNLEAGQHTITASATNKAGLISSATVEVYVDPSSPLNTGSSGMCFIATAAYGSYLHPHVASLREFRDTYLMTNSIGQGFVNLYYQVSPPLAEAIANNHFMGRIVRVLLLPVVGFSIMALHIGLVPCIVMILAAILMVGCASTRLMSPASQKR